MASYSELEHLQMLLLNKDGANDNGFSAPCTNTDCDSHAHYMGPPFAEGSFRYAFKARYCRGAIKHGKEVGKKCVVKKFKHKHVYNMDFWKRDLKMCETSQQLANGWNKLKKISKSYIVLQPIIGICQDKYTIESNKNQPQFGEQLLCEDYLDGKFQKWNSNSGWIENNSIDSSVQAFCHWTYHYTDRNFLFCDAQG